MKNNIIFNTFEKIFKSDNLNIKITTSEKILNYSHGEIINNNTINYKTFIPEADGLFCQKIFGPIKDYECICKKYIGIKYLYIICDICNVQILNSSHRKKRMGHISLGAPMSHIWYLKSSFFKLGILLNLSTKSINEIIYFDKYIVINPGFTKLKINSLITFKKYLIYKNKKKFIANIGVEAILELLNNFNINLEIKKTKNLILNEKNKIKIKNLYKRLKLINVLKNKTFNYKSLFLFNLPILPCDLRPIVLLENGTIASSDFNILYKNIIYRNNRLKILIEFNASHILLINEKKLLQESIDSLFDNSKCNNFVIIKNFRNKPLKSLSDVLRGKKGIFRQNLLGKRVDYSARSVIVSGPKLKLNQCGIPKLILLELFKPIISYKLKCNNIDYFNKKLINIKNNMFLFLHKIIKNYNVLLNRAPTLHRLGIQSFEIKLIYGKAIQLHPLVCSAFNADFDGDQMAVHLSLSIESQLENKTITLSNKNILLPSNGEPSITPNQDVILGIYYATQNGYGNYELTFNNIDEIINLYNINFLKLFQNIILNIKEYYQINKYKYIKVINRYKTTVGRAIMSKFLPKGLLFSNINKLLNKKKFSKIIKLAHEKCGITQTTIFIDKIMRYGFIFSTKSGISINLNNILIPNNKFKFLIKSYLDIKNTQNYFMYGFLTFGECQEIIINKWIKINNIIGNFVILEIKKNINNKNYINSLYLMSNSGARGSNTQIKQLSGMRGMMLKPNGTIVETPIISNLKEGLTIFQYFLSTHGARKGLTDTSLKTANAGYLTRRLVDVAQSIIIKNNDCKSKKYMIISPFILNNEIIELLSDRVFSKTLAENIYLSNTKFLLYQKSIQITENISKQFYKLGLNELKIRNPINCKIDNSLCAQCYGLDLSKKKLIKIGEAAGIIAGQSIGEPGTQLTMRTFHGGGVSENNFSEITNDITTNFDCYIFLSYLTKIVKKKNIYIVTSKYGYIYILCSKNFIIKEKYKVSSGTVLFYKNGSFIKKKNKIFNWQPYTQNIVAEFAGIIEFKNIIYNITVNEHFNLKKRKKELKIIKEKYKINKNKYIYPYIILKNLNNKKIKSYQTNKNIIIYLKKNMIISVKNKQIISAGDIIAYYTKNFIKKHFDITGGLPKIANLFEARSSDIEYSSIYKLSGITHFCGENISKYYIKIISFDGKYCNFYVDKVDIILLANNQIINKGDIIIEGEFIRSKDILYNMGKNYLINYLINEIQYIYRLQGININDKHIEIIIRQMLKFGKIINQGNSDYIINDLVEIIELKKNNIILIKNKKLPILYKNILLGITKTSLLSKSFMSAASFQETTKILANSAILKKKDLLKGLKENVMLGRIIPAGTGYIK